MNTLQNLIDNGIEINTAIRMLSEYQKRINTSNGIYKIIDITYDFNERGKDVTLECTNCGKVIHRMMVSGRNKWSELIKTCECQKIEKNEKKRISENSKKIKKAIIFDRIGKEYGDYKIISVDDIDDNPKYTMACMECGAEKIVSATNFDKIKNFHCTKHCVQPIKFNESYIGKKNNFLKVIGISRFPKNNHRAFVCECDCGNIKLIEPAHWEQGIIKSCGCMHGELNKISATRHGHSGDRLYRVWNNMKQRCCNKNNSNYKNYGGRGISVCQEWLDFMNFYDWAMENGYDYNAEFGECTIDRIDVNGNYEPSNCRWVDVIVQAENKRPIEEQDRKKYEYQGEKYFLYELCEMFNTSDPAVRYRMKELGMSLEQALTSPKFTDGRPRKQR